MVCDIYEKSRMVGEAGVFARMLQTAYKWSISSQFVG
jgi:hypothetical protein